MKLSYLHISIFFGKTISLSDGLGQLYTFALYVFYLKLS